MTYKQAVLDSVIRDIELDTSILPSSDEGSSNTHTVDHNKIEDESVQIAGSSRDIHASRDDVLNPKIKLEEGYGSFDPASVVGLKLTKNEKLFLLKLEPCQPPKEILKSRKKVHGDRERYCSQKAFYHDDQNRRKWTSFSFSTNSIYCIPCLLFSDEMIRGENKRLNQGNAFSCERFANWKNQAERIKKHENSKAHVGAKVAQVLFESGLDVANRLDKQAEASESKRKREVMKNREIMERIIDVIILLGKQGSAFRGHDEKLSLDNTVNNGNFLETLKLLAKYDEKIGTHLKKYEYEKPLLKRKKEKNVVPQKLHF